MPVLNALLIATLAVTVVALFVQHSRHARAEQALRAREEQFRLEMADRRHSQDSTDRRQAEELIRESQAALEDSNREVQQLAGRLIGAQEAERGRIARDLHDDVSQQIAGLAIALSSLKRRVTATSADTALLDDVVHLQQRTNTLAEHVRHLSHDLHPGVLRHAGLEAALASFVADLQRHHALDVTCDTEGDFTTLDADVALCLYRVAQEALRNVVTHASATRASVTLQRVGEMTELTVVDDGQGFDIVSTRQRREGLGLISMGERARMIGGTVSVVTELSRGTRVRMQVPAGLPGTSAR